MTFAIFTQPSGLKRLVTPEYVVAVQSTAGDAVSRVWTVADSAPGASRGYSIVTGTFAATVAAVGAGLVTLALPDGGQIALAPQWVTQLEQLPGNAATRVVWAADSEGGYATVLGTLAATAAALAYAPSVGGFELNAPLNTSHGNASPVTAGAFYSPGIAPGTVEALVYSVNATTAQVQLTTLVGALQATMVDAAPAAGWRVLTATPPTTIVAGWKNITLAQLAGSGLSYVFGFRIAP